MVQRIVDVADVFQGLGRAGRGAGSRRGDWKLRIVESGDLREDGWLDSHDFREVGVIRSVRTERHLLRPFDVLVTARAGSVQAALVPPGVSRTVAGITILVVRARQAESGMGHWLWYLLTSSHGRTQLARRLTVSTTVTTLSARSLGEIEVPVPHGRELDRITRLVEASEEAYFSTLEAARLRRETLRDSVIQDVGRRAESITL